MTICYWGEPDKVSVKCHTSRVSVCLSVCLLYVVQCCFPLQKEYVLFSQKHLLKQCDILQCQLLSKPVLLKVNLAKLADCSLSFSLKLCKKRCALQGRFCSL